MFCEGFTLSLTKGCGETAITAVSKTAFLSSNLSIPAKNPLESPFSKCYIFPVPNPERRYPLPRRDSFKKRLAAAGMSVIMSGAPISLPAHYDPIQANPDQQYGMYSYGIQGYQVIKDTGDISRGFDPTEGRGKEYGEKDKEKLVDLLETVYDANLNFVFFSWYPDIRDDFWTLVDDVMTNPSNPYKDLVKTSFVYEPESNEDSMELSRMNDDIGKLSRFFDKPYFLKNKDGKPVFTVFASEWEGFVNNSGYVQKWDEIAEKYGAYIILEDYPGISLNPSYQNSQDRIGSISYGDDPWLLTSDGYREGRNAVRIRWSYHKPGDFKWQDYSATQLKTNIGRMLASGEEFGIGISIDEGYEDTQATPQVFDIFKASLPDRASYDNLSREEKIKVLRNKAQDLRNGESLPPPPFLIYDNATDRTRRQRIA